jgi:hypothetical protein
MPARLRRVGLGFQHLGHWRRSLEIWTWSAQVFGEFPKAHSRKRRIRELVVGVGYGKFAHFKLQFGV